MATKTEADLVAVLTLDGLRTWLATKSGPYNYCGPGTCLLAQYVRDGGFTGISVGPSWIYTNEGYVRIPCVLHDIALGLPTPSDERDTPLDPEWTFEKALERADKASVA
jgi:hypothetical protein